MNIYLYDEFDPETSAMLQALYSRSSDSVTAHVKKVKERGSANFMASYYVGYGHASIGDCGVTTLYIEDISILACKAIQDFSLYSGQETSTRYINFSSRRLHDPCGHKATQNILRRWINFYTEVSEKLVPIFKKDFPCGANDNPIHWEKAVQARVFDVARGFLPAGVTSQLAWTTNLRQAHEQLLRLETHPLEEVRTIGTTCRSILREKYPNSFGHSISPEDISYLKNSQATEAYARAEEFNLAEDCFECIDDVAEFEDQGALAEILSTRPRRSHLPRTLSRLGLYRSRFLLDYGSFRDLQRHRGGLCRMPLLTDKYGFNSWYLNQLPLEMKASAIAFVGAQLQLISELKNITFEDLQYYLPIGMNVACELQYGLPEMVYVAELRSSQTVHPTLRRVAHEMIKFLKKRHPLLKIYADESPDMFSVRRGSQDIVDRHEK